MRRPMSVTDHGKKGENSRIKKKIRRRREFGDVSKTRSAQGEKRKGKKSMIRRQSQKDWENERGKKRTMEDAGDSKKGEGQEPARGCTGLEKA